MPEGTERGRGPIRGINGQWKEGCLEMEFLEINLTKDSSLLLHPIHSLSTGGFVKKTRLYSGERKNEGR
jgi:hypothetical protein